MRSRLCHLIRIQSGTLVRAFNSQIVKRRRADQFSFFESFCFYTESTHRELCVFLRRIDECLSHDGLFSGSIRKLLIDMVVKGGPLGRNYNFVAVCRGC